MSMVREGLATQHDITSHNRPAGRSLRLKGDTTGATRQPGSRKGLLLSWVSTRRSHWNEVYPLSVSIDRTPDLGPRFGAVLKPIYRFEAVSMRFLGHDARWRPWIAYCTAIALLLPSVALLPAVDFESAAVHGYLAAAHSDLERDHAGGGSPERLSDLPGGATHPINHDCVPCQVIKFLATGFMPQADTALSPMSPGNAPPVDEPQQPPPIAGVALSPPIRAPPYPSFRRTS